MNKIKHLSYWIEHFNKGSELGGILLEPIDCKEIYNLLIKLKKLLEVKK